MDGMDRGGLLFTDIFVQVQQAGFLDSLLRRRTVSSGLVPNPNLGIRLILPEMTRHQRSDPVPSSQVRLLPHLPLLPHPLPKLECAQAHIQFLFFN